MPKADVWIIKRRRKRGVRYAVRWVDPSTGRMRCETCGTDQKLAKDFANRKRDELRRGINNDPIDVSWDRFASTEIEQAQAEKSAVYADMIRCTLDLFKMICEPRGPLAVNYRMARDFIRIRLQGARRCPRRSCGFSNAVDLTRCWRCDAELPDRVRAVTPTTVNRSLRVLRAAFSNAKKLYRLPSNPLDEIPPLETQDKPIRALSPGEQRRVLAACPDLRWRTFCYLAITTGLRRRELCDIRWDDVDLEAKRLSVNKTKAKKCHTVRLTDEAVQLLDRLRLTHAHPTVFVSDKGGDLYWAVGTMMDRIVEAAGVPRFTCHDQRKTFGTDLARAGVSQRVATDLIGHGDIRTTARYYQAVDEEMAADAIGRLPLVKSRTA